MSSIEYQILLAASDVNPGDEQRESLACLMVREFDQARLIDMAVREGVAGLLFKNLKKAGVLSYLRHDQIQCLQSAYYLTVRFNLNLIYDLKEVLHALNQKKLKVVLLQGMSLLQQIYKDIGLRPLTDIDLWVLPETLAAVETVLTRLGFQQDRLYPHTFKKGSTIIDINCHIFWADRIKSRRLLLNDRQKEFLLNCRTIDFEGEKAYCLSETDQFLYLSLHVIKHYAQRLIWLVDLKNLLQGWQASSWAKLVKRSEATGQEKGVSYILFLLVRLFRIQPPETSCSIRTDLNMSRLERMVLERRLKGSALPVWSPMLLFTSGRGFWKSAGFVLESLFPRPPVLRQIFSDRPDFRTWQLYVKRALHLFRIAKGSKSA